MSRMRRAYWAGKRLFYRALEAMRGFTVSPLDETDIAEGSVDSILCVVANIRETVPFGPGGGETRSGHRRFSAGTKVYVLAPSWDWVTHGTFECVARRRRSHRFVRQVLDRRFLTNWRISREYSPALITRIRANRLGHEWSRRLAERVVEHETALIEQGD